MGMKNMVFKERLKKIASDNSLDLKQLSAEIGFSYRTIQNYLAGISVPKADFYEKLSTSFGVSPNWVILGIEPMYVSTKNGDLGKEFPTGKENPTFVPIQRYEVDASAGHGTQVSDEMPQGVYAFNERWLERRNLSSSSLSVISVSGNSMEPDLYDNDLVLIDHASNELADSNIYAVRFSGALYVKRIQHQPSGKVLLISKNKDYPPIEITHPVADGVEVIGRIVASMHEW